MLCLVCNVAFHVPTTPALSPSHHIPAKGTLILDFITQYYSPPSPKKLHPRVFYSPSFHSPTLPSSSCQFYSLRPRNQSLASCAQLISHPRHAAALNVALYSFMSKLIFHNVCVSHFLHLWVDTQADGTSWLL